MADKSDSHKKRTKAILERYLLLWLGDKPIQDIQAAELFLVLERIQSTGAIETAHRAMQVVSQIFRYSVSKGKVESDITLSLKGQLKTPVGKNFAAITKPHELRPLLLAIDDYKGGFAVKCALQLAPLLFVRPGELRLMKWQDIDFKTAEWRYTITKTKTEHLVPLSKQAIEILNSIRPFTGHGNFVLPSPKTPNGSRCLSDMALLTALRRMGFEKHETTVHGFRATARTLLAEVLHFNPAYIEHQLGHTVPDANGTAYNRTKFLKERKVMMQQWSDYLDSLKTGAEIIPFQRQA
jgi:integrase